MEGRREVGLAGVGWRDGEKRHTTVNNKKILLLNNSKKLKLKKKESKGRERSFQIRQN